MRVSRRTDASDCTFRESARVTDKTDPQRHYVKRETVTGGKA